VIEVVESPGGSLADRLEASRWRIDVDGTPEVVEAGVAAFLAAEQVLVERMTKKGLREFDARGAVVSLTVTTSGYDDRSALDVVLRHGVPAVRPDDVLTALVSVSDVEPGPAPLMTRLAQGPLAEDGTVGDPFVA
jgi:hypothetical protein